MIRKTGHPFIAAIAMVALGACSTTGGVLGNGVTNTSVGSLGTRPGSGSFASSSGGLLRESILGPELATQLDVKSQRVALEAEQRALETATAGQAVLWEGKKGIAGEVVPEHSYQVGSQDCRRYSHTVTIDGVPRKASGSACRNSDGSWSVLS